MRSVYRAFKGVSADLFEREEVIDTRTPLSSNDTRRPDVSLSGIIIMYAGVGQLVVLVSSTRGKHHTTQPHQITFGICIM